MTFAPDFAAPAANADIADELRRQSRFLVETNANIGDDVLPIWERAANEIDRLEEELIKLASQADREERELRRRIDDVLDLIDGMEDVQDAPDCGDEQIVQPNLAMRVGMILRGEDRP